MTVFAVVSRTANPDLERKISETYPAAYHRFSDQAWFIFSNQSAREVSEAIGVKRDGFSGVVVLATTGAYYGVANSSDWDWLKSAVERADG